MLGKILGGLTNAAAAEELLAAIADEALLERVKTAADENDVTPGTYVAATVRHLLDHGSEEIWLDLVGKMANSPQPGAAALQAILLRAFRLLDGQNANEARNTGAAGMNAIAPAFGCATGGMPLEMRSERVPPLGLAPLAFESVPLTYCVGRVLAEPFKARLNRPVSISRRWMAMPYAPLTSWRHGHSGYRSHCCR